MIQLCWINKDIMMHKNLQFILFIYSRWCFYIYIKIYLMLCSLYHKTVNIKGTKALTMSSVNYYNKSILNNLFCILSIPEKIFKSSHSAFL